MRSAVLITVLVAAILVSFLGLLLFMGLDGGYGGMGHDMMMGAETSRSIWLVFFAVPLVVAVAVLGYALAFPELSGEKPREKPSSVPTVEKGESALDAVLRVLNDDEKKVIETLVAEDGTMLQKDIRWKSGLSRVKTHRILFRLAKRGIVSAEKHYNTNKITLADWLIEKKREP